MQDLGQYIETLVHVLGLNEEEIGLRKAFLEFSDHDEARLRRAHDLLGSESAEFADAFYEHLTKFATLRSKLEGDERLARLKHVQSQYFKSLTAGRYGDGYIRDRLRVGVVHQRIGLEPVWYLGAYRKYVAEIQRMLW
ncbi:MAG: GGDEF domain-containing protein, partial [Pusillimonas sp.]|nr:GGDEF domain-containing protein [Pusillimonas sp.]